MADRVIVSKSDVVGTKEWAERLVDAIKTDHRYSERDVSLFAEHAAEAKLNEIWKVVSGGDWLRFCAEYLNLPAAYVDAIMVGVGTLRGAGHNGPIPAEQAKRVAALANEPKPLQLEGGDKRSDQYQNHYYNYNSDSPQQQGTSADYLTARIARDRPDILERMKTGEYRSVRQAAIEAGIVNAKTRYSLPSDPIAAGRYLAQRVDDAWFEALSNAYYKERQG